MPALAPYPRVPRRALSSRSITVADGARTTLHVMRFARAGTRARVVALPGTQRLAAWCEVAGIRDAVVGGFFVRPDGRPLGEVRVAGRELASVPFDSPWDRLRSCVQIDGHAVRLAPRWTMEAAPPGDLLQAGPLLVAHGRSVIREGGDPEGFASGAHQFDSDITSGRYPRAALALTSDDLLAVVCEGRADREAGLTLAELALQLVRLGAERAINLDGGGSASLVYDGRLRNAPREEHGIPLVGGRPVATAIAFEPA